MDQDLLTNAMTREAFAPIETAYKSTVDFMTGAGVPPGWVFACLVVIVMGRSFGRVLERVTDHVLDRRDGRPQAKKED